MHFVQPSWEHIYYSTALNRQEGPLMEGSIIRFILGAVPLFIGFFMCGVTWNRKTHKYNPVS